MKKIKIIITLCVLIFSADLLRADDFHEAMLDAKEKFEAAVNSGDEKEIIKVRGQFERIRQLNKDVWLVDYWIALSDYNIAMLASRSQDTEKVKKYTQTGLERIDGSILQRYDFADSYVVQMMLQFNRWMYEQDQMDAIISASQTAETGAIENDPKNPRLWLVKGIAQYYTPAAFGGGEAKAIESFEKSEEYFNTTQPASEIHPDWGEEMLYGFYALAYIKRDKSGDLEKAKEYIDKALVLSPESQMINGMVMPEYEKAMK